MCLLASGRKVLVSGSDRLVYVARLIDSGGRIWSPYFACSGFRTEWKLGKILRARQGSFGDPHFTLPPDLSFVNARLYCGFHSLEHVGGIRQFMREPFFGVLGSSEFVGEEAFVAVIPAGTRYYRGTTYMVGDGRDGISGFCSEYLKLISRLDIGVGDREHWNYCLGR